MKKYLMIGFAALAFAGCANHDFEPMTQQEIVKAEYDAKFVADFGQPASNHTWGFGSTTRAFTRGVFANGNEWAANDKEGCMYDLTSSPPSSHLTVAVSPECPPLHAGNWRKGLRSLWHLSRHLTARADRKSVV